MLRTLPLLAVTGALMVVSGYVHGVYSGRWTDPAELDRAAARLAQVPLQIGDWDGQPDELAARSVKQAGFHGYLVRTYKNRRTGATVWFLLACGRSGPLSVHTPEQCYRGLGYQQHSAAEHYTAAGPGSPPGVFWTAKFGKGTGAGALQQRVNWAWNRGSGWEAPGSPRFALAGVSALYKMYVTHPVEGADEPAAQGASSEFLREALPVLQQALSPKS